MMAVESTEILTPLETANVERRKAAKAEKKEAIRASTNILDSRACAGKVEAIGKACNAAVLAARPAEVLRLRDKLRVAEVDSEIATTRAATSTARHAAAVEKLQQAEAEVRRCAEVQATEEMIALAQKCTAALDDVVARLGEPLLGFASQNFLNRPLNVPPREIPPVVLAAVERLEKLKPHDLDTPVHELRYRRVHPDLFAARVAELMADGHEDLSVALA